jgi:tripartite-type tricarboxylate transporter receptor subunit TctC
MFQSEAEGTIMGVKPEGAAAAARQIARASSPEDRTGFSRPCGRVRAALHGVGLVLMLWATSSTFAFAQNTADEAAFFSGKQIRLIVGFGAGGGYDAYARLIAPYLARELEANVIVENQPGAGGVTALNNFVTSKPDGLRIMLANGWSNGISQLMEAPGVRYDLTRVSHLGTISASPSVWLVHKTSSLHTIDDVRKRGRSLNWSGLSPNDGLFVGARVTCAALKIPCSIVLGYKDTNEAALALARGEVDSVFVGDTSANDYAQINDVRPLATMARQRSRFFPDLSTVFEQAKLSDEAEFLLNFEAGFERLGRILILPPGAAPERLAFLRQVVARTLRNPKLIAEGEKSHRYIDFIDAETTAETVAGTLANLSQQQRDHVRKILTAEPSQR